MDRDVIPSRHPWLFSTVFSWLWVLRLAIRELFLDGRGGMRWYLESPVKLMSMGAPSCRWFQAETPLPGPPSLNQGHCRAILVPGSLVLFRHCQLPLSAEPFLATAMELEVGVSSPFPSGESCHGWTLKSRVDGQLDVVLAIACRGMIHQYLHKPGVRSGESKVEAWCVTDDGLPVILRGFGEGVRAWQFRWRLGVLGVLVSVFLALMVALLALPGQARQWRAERLESQLIDVRGRAANALSLYRQLDLDNQLAMALQGLVEERVDYRHRLDQLSDLTPDDVYLQHLHLEGDWARLRGMANSAAGYMQVLAGDGRFKGVTAPAGIRRDPRSGLEQFSLELRLANGGGEP